MKSSSRFLSFAVACVLPLAIGCGSNITLAPLTTPTMSSDGSGTMTYTGSYGHTASTIYVIQDDYNTETSSILEFAAQAQGSATPTATLNGPASTIFYAVTVDASGNLYVGAETEIVNPNAVFEIFEYAAGATGAATPMRTISTSSGIVSLAVDSAGQIYALTWDGIDVFAANATGNATPIRQIPANTTTTTLDYPFGIAVDLGGNIYVANSSNILVFSPTANGNVAPARMISPSITPYGALNGVAVEANGAVYATMITCTGGLACIESSQILAFDPGANGLVPPANSLTIQPDASFPNANTQVSGVAVDSAGNLYAQVFTYTSYGLGAPTILNAVSVEVFTPGQTSTSAPSQTITSAAWNSSAASQLAVH